MNDNFLKALRREPVSRTPVWLMRQAGRYLPEYRELRARAGSFMNLCQSPELACEVTLQPLARFDLDAAILFSDILTIPDALGLGLRFDKGHGPVFEKTVRDGQAVSNLAKDYPSEKLGYVADAVRLIHHELSGRVPLIGFSGSPWTLACYMIEGQGSKDFALAKKMMYQSPELMHQLLTTISHHVSCYLLEQIEAGVDAIMLFDTWGGLLTTEHYPLFSLNYMKSILDAVKAKSDKPIPSIIFTKGGGQWLELMADTGASALGLDWTVDIGSAFARVGQRVALQGNLDPSLMMTEPNAVSEAARAICAKVNKHLGHVFNLGHGITPDAKIENVEALIEAVHAA